MNIYSLIFFICFSAHSSFSHSAHSLGSDLPNQNIWRHEQADIPCWIPVDDRSERDFQNNDSRGTLQHPLGQAKPCILLQDEEKMEMHIGGFQD